MGTTILAKCECGYVSGEIFAGRGMFSKTYVLPAMCPECKKAIGVKYEQNAQCPDCKTPVTFYAQKSSEKNTLEMDDIASLFEYDFGNGKIRPAPSFLCPKCQKNTLRFEDIGSWD